ncbi:tex-like protein N-terminal domain protein [Clostridium sp. CAG:169]|mgnify:FL=1|nr:tex-like protein N-terminal domain protein [Clostridium sp. CAG:169]
MDMIETLAKELSIGRQQAESAVRLLDEDNTIPFIARYRKEVTGGLDDTVLRALEERLRYLRSLQKRREEVFALIQASGKLNEQQLNQVEVSLQRASLLSEVEDIYRPYKQKRKTRASAAREKGLEPLAQFLQAQRQGSSLEQEAQKFIDPKKGVEDAAQAIAGAQDILAEQLSDSPQVRARLRDYLQKNARILTTIGTKENKIYKMYSDYSESIGKIPSHRVLAIDRGEREEALKVSLEADSQAALHLLEQELIRKNSPFAKQLREVCEDSYKRLLFPSLERQIRAQLTERADAQAIGVFSENLKNLLMQPPVKGAVTMGFDPAYRTGCKIAVVDPTGKVLDTTVVYPTPPASRTEEAKKILTQLIQKYGVTVIAVGNGTASKESEIFVAQLLGELNPKLQRKVSYMVVSEAGASVYSASELGAKEFPQFDVSLRSAVSIARRLQDPLAELVKIDPKSIGVGQYQHDMPAKEMDAALGGVVEDCVNRVGVDLNTASQSLLSYVAGINQTVAKNIVSYREESGSFTKRSQLMKVPKLGKKAFEQCAGFLRVPESEEPLDRTGVHPESYPAAQKLLTLCGYQTQDLLEGKLEQLAQRVAQMGQAQVAQRIGVGEPTLWDMVAELSKPGRDPRDELPKPLLRTDVMEMSDLKEGMVLTGTVRNVTDFGAFVDIAVHEDGLVHISQISKRRISHPSQVLKVGDIVQVKVLEVDLERRRISLTMKDL